MDPEGHEEDHELGQTCGGRQMIYCDKINQ
jgi:hypothetical protein